MKPVSLLLTLAVTTTPLVVLHGGQREVDTAAVQAKPGSVTAEMLGAAIGRLGDLEYSVRMEAGRTVRRATSELAVPALIRAVEEHADGYVRFRALVLLSGFGDPRGRDLMVRMLDDPNDRLRTVAYSYFEHNPEVAVAPRLFAALEREESEFVRPALVRALSANADGRAARETLLLEAGRGQDFFRSAVIEALGDYHAQYATATLIRFADLEGPLQDDVALALGKIGDQRALATLASLQRRAPRATQPAVAAAICLLGVNCASHERYLSDALRFAIDNIGFQDLLRGAAFGLAALATAGNSNALGELLDQGIPTRDPARAPIALATGAVVLRNTSLALSVLEKRSDLDRALELLRESFDMLEEDYAKERFFVTVRRRYWQAEEGSATRRLGEALIDKLEF